MNTLLLLGGLVLLGCFVLGGILCIKNSYSDRVDDEKKSFELRKNIYSRANQFFDFIQQTVTRKTDNLPNDSKEKLTNGKCDDNVRITLVPGANYTVAARFDCRLISVPLQDITWASIDSVKERIGFNTNIYELRNSGARLGSKSEIYSLLIQNAQKSDNGTYICTAKNQYGIATTETVLTVLDGNAVGKDVGKFIPYCSPVGNVNTFTDSIAPRDESGDTQILPFFIKHLPRNIEVQKGTDIRLDCIAN